MVFQKTIKQTIETVGIGLHSGKKVGIRLRPAPVDTGIVFWRKDLPKPVAIHARADAVSNTTMCTILEQNGARVATIEHLMAALAGLGIDNLYVDLDSEEVPIMDGSSAPFIFLIQAAGIESQSKAKKVIRIKKPIEVRDGDRWARFVPYNGFKIDFTIDFQHPVFKQQNQSLAIDFSNRSFVGEVSKARTFGFLKDLEKLHAANLALGGSVDNAIVMNDYRVINQDGLRYSDEFVRHKILDAVGDVYLAGYAILGELQAYKSGHALNNVLVRKMLAQKKSYELISLDQETAQSGSSLLDEYLVPVAVR
ncbi:MAG: UDP-3-O-acyl-N-acetylglucosamine deacetylase [Pseudomonadota bacterium]|nr:UDP-3-O-[3-hydroxymyristoyl] N-acetylglucosamine deacetylase [Gammaproteobacteria bacterium]MEC8009899.1 UDP-3-O-acyl-N-acetylglucosamine deacetylase [Pseudomonadota bacterium]HBF09752.1 UDP-3-O-[3-hydroxymyristoyl] N-acetylglucosamine deacetylase [Gammaproteobacteria bacterium]|tara:strand:+ start:46317 stop:47243 length:927 start_codon:yes stop_codon:yes gene_type:complete